MTSPTGLHHHPYADELLEDYLLGTLSAEETAWMQAHVESCPRCQAEVEASLGAVQALPFSAPEPDVPISDDLWVRIERSISTSPGGTGSSGMAGSDAAPSNVRFLPLARATAGLWLTVAALMLVSIVSGVVLAAVLPQIGTDDEGAQRIAAEFTDPSVDASGELLYLPEEHVFVLDLSGMPELPEGQVYQAWFIEGDVPTSAGVMNAGTDVFATAGDRDNLQMFCITVEPGPLGSEAPTTDPILVAPLDTSQDN